MPKLDITSQERSALRAAAHPLRPVVLIGDRGLSESVLKEIDLNLTAHNLIKVRVGGEERAAREAILETICESLSCAPIHHLGKTLIIYRPNQAAIQAEAEAANTTRARRKPTEPH
ncbi:MAG TPA: YhbY family RNA-binding protein, partial [Eoetvoesiella sp.]